MPPLINQSNNQSRTLRALGFCLLFSLFLFELHVSVDHHSPCELVDVLLLLLGEAQDVNGRLES